MDRVKLDVKVIGAGGIGSILLNKISRFFNYMENYETSITIVDGDSFESKNEIRQEFNTGGNKAASKAFELSKSFLRVSFSSVSEYLDKYNIEEVIKSGDFVLVCVDNHATRKLISDYAKTLENITIISGGNDYVDGNVQVYIRKEGYDKTPSLTAYHPEIQNPDDRSPNEMSCEELSKSEPQLFFANLGVATIMCWVIYNILTSSTMEINTSEIYFDIPSMRVAPKTRAVK